MQELSSEKANAELLTTQRKQLPVAKALQLSQRFTSLLHWLHHIII